MREAERVGTQEGLGGILLNSLLEKMGNIDYFLSFLERFTAVLNYSVNSLKFWLLVFAEHNI